MLISRQINYWFLSAFFAGISVLFFFSFWLLPMLGCILSLWTSIPLLILYKGYGAKAGRIGILLGLIGVLLLGEQFSSAIIGRLSFFYYATMSLILGESTKFRLSIFKRVTVAGFIAASVIGAILVYGIFLSGQKIDIVWENQCQYQLESMLTNYYNIGIDHDQALAISCALIQLTHFFLNLFPGFLVAVSLMLAWANLALARNFLSLGTKSIVEEKEKFSLFKAPETLIWLLVIAVVATLSGDNWLYFFGINILLILGITYFIQGLAVLVYWLEKKKVPRVLRWGLYALLAAEFFLAILVALTGLFDIWLNFRQLEKTPPV